MQKMKSLQGFLRELLSLGSEGRDWELVRNYQEVTKGE